MSRAALAGFLALLLATTAAGAVEPAGEPAAVLETLRQAQLDPAQAREIRGLRLNTGAVILQLDRGFLFPASAPGLASAEMVFIGSGMLELTPPDEIEAGQLELFTDQRRLAERFEQAVFVIARDEAARTLLDRPLAAEVPAATAVAAAERFASWRAGPHRRQLGVESGLLLDTLGDPLYGGFFAAWFKGAELGELLLAVDPDAEEQITLGQFVPLEITAKQERKLDRLLHQEQRRGRWIGLETADLGSWDTWISTPLRTTKGEPRPGFPGFEPERYILDLAIDPRTGTLDGKATLELRALTDARRTVRLELHPDLAVRQIRDGEGRELFHLRAGSRIDVLLPEVVAADALTRLEITWSGSFFDEGDRRNWALRDTRLWHPRAGQLDRARYDVTLRWPKKLDLVASGRLADHGESGDQRWERRTLELPSLGFGFEIGRFETRTLRAGKVEVIAAFDPSIRNLSGDSLDQILAVATDALAFYEEVFGPYPLGELRLVTVPRLYSQALPGFVTLSNAMMIDWQSHGLELGLEDRRTVIAHEVAHQWWGNRVGWNSYRDQWLSEAMANYSALLWARRRLPPGELAENGPTQEWQQVLGATLDDGRSLESIGPVVLGQRLSSSKTDEAYEAVVYKKGAVVLDMLAFAMGEERFLEALRRLAELAADKVLSTADFLELMGRLRGVELGDFGRRFVYGTGIPEIDYGYRFEPLEGGGHKVHLEALQSAPYRFRYAVVETPRGLDVARERVEEASGAGSPLIVPLQIRARRAGQPDKVESEVLLSRPVVLENGETHLELEIEHTPLALELDPKTQVLGRFFDRNTDPRWELYRRALERAAAGESVQAETLLRQALTTKTPPAPASQRGDKEVFEALERLRSASIHLELARLSLDDGRLEEAGALLEGAQRVTKGWERSLNVEQVRRLEARLALLRGDPETTFRKLDRAILKRGTSDATEGYLLLAIAARATGKTEAFEEALEVARKRGARVALLREPPTSTELKGDQR